MKILYHLSMDDRVKVLFTQSDCVKLLTDMLLLNVNSDLSCENGPGTTDILLALCVNLSWNERAAQQMASEGRLRELLARAFRHRNSMLMKLEFVGDVAGAVTSGDAPEEFVIECLDAKCDPELVLEGVVCAGAVCAEQRCAEALCAGGGGAALVAALRQRQADDEHVLQTVFAFRQMWRDSDVTMVSGCLWWKHWEQRVGRETRLMICRHSQTSLNDDSDSLTGVDYNRVNSRNTQDGRHIDDFGISDSVSAISALDDDTHFSKTLNVFA
ncbi:unnamed protein product [Leptidea sinapis]|uniref:Uncharacterized protein n=1 Tax=Leptidea sinapis TaxID=189913 RepID=A0A5E4Q3W3_9NEOP|nr:unnamed protein product [Leptidea sinapis]